MTRRSLTMAVLGTAALLISGCAAPAEDTPTAVETELEDTDVVDVSDECQQAVDEVAGAEDLNAAVEQVDTAISACVDLGELRSAAGSLEGVDMEQIESFVAERCEAADDPMVTESQICEEVTG
jgi:PBP1b-binding outer membrane lipoprotein LpoB